MLNIIGLLTVTKVSFLLRKMNNRLSKWENGCLFVEKNLASLT